MKIRVLIVDDEVLARVRVRQLLQSEPDVEVIGESGSGADAITFIREHRPDLVFLDVQMPELSGIEVLRALPAQQRPATIFVTAHDQHALEAFEVHALDFLLKPCKPSRFQEALQRARDHLQTRTTDPSRGDPGQSQAAEPSPCPSHIMIKTGERDVFIGVEDLEYVEAAGNYAILHVGRESHVLRETLKNLLLKLPSTKFLRVNRSAIVNLNFVSEVRHVSRRDRVVVLNNGKTVEVTGSVREIRRRLENRESTAPRTDYERNRLP